MTRQQLFAVFFFAAFSFLLYQFYRMFSVFLVPLTWAGLLAFIFYPFYTGLTRRLRGRAGLAALLLTTAVILAVMVPMVMLIILLAHESAVLYQSSSAFFSGPGLQEVIERLRASTPARAWTLWTAILQGWNIDLAGIAGKSTNAISGFLVAQVGGAVKNVTSFLLNFFLTTFALFFFFRDGSRIVGGIRELLPMEAGHKDLVLTRLYETLSAVVQGTLITAAAQGTLAGVGYWALGVPFAVLLGCVSAFVSLLPFGSPVVWGSVAIYLGATGSIGRAVILALWGILVVGTVDNVLRPLLIGGRTEIPTILLFFGILGGLQAYGFLGVFLAPVVIAILVAFLRIYREQYSYA